MRAFAISVAIALLAGLSTQATAQDAKNYRAHLSDEANTGTLAQGQATFQVTKDGNGLRFKLIVANIEDVIMAHIHLRPNADTPNGPPVVWLYPSAPPPVEIEGRSQGTLAQGTITAGNLVGPLAGQDLSELFAAMDSGLTYVNVHTTANQNGEIRGEIH